MRIRSFLLLSLYAVLPREGMLYGGMATLTFHQPTALLFVPDDRPHEVALARTPHLGIGAHPSATVKDTVNPRLVGDRQSLLSAFRPEIVYTHSLDVVAYIEMHLDRFWGDMVTRLRGV